jgi:hypothetical protein
MNENPDFSNLQKLRVSLGVFLLIQSMLSKDPNKRLSIEECLKMAWWYESK